MAEPPPLPPEDVVLAAELALGVLDGEDHAAARRRQLADLDFAAAVEHWALRFAPLSHGIADAPVPPALWDRIAERLPDAGDLRVVRALRRWRAAAIAAGAAAAVLLAIVLVRPDPAAIAPVPATAPAIVAQITGDEGVALAARYDPAQAVLHVRTDNMPASPLAPELWVIPAGGKPVSLGLVASRGDRALAVAPGHRALIEEGATLAITMEPAAGAPHPGPSGPPVAAGKITIL
ncbi:anti-sigma factor [Sphingomonas sp. RS6]